jgi:hypothetical protein
MTHEETIQEIKEMIENININEIKDHDSDILLQSWIRSWRGRMKTLVDQLGKELCSDAIDRQAAIDALGEEPPVWYDGEDEIAERDQWKRDIEAIKSLPSVRPKIKVGHWIEWTDDIDDYVKCSCCDYGDEGDVKLGDETNYCPHCGAKMEES